MRFSKQREVVYSVLAATDTHPDVQWIYLKAREVLPNISLGTVYRNLNELVSAGRAMRICADGESERFDARAYAHPHFTCLKCGCISDILPSKVHLSVDVDNVLRTDIMVYGVCAKCTAADCNLHDGK